MAVIKSEPRHSREGEVPTASCSVELCGKHGAGNRQCTWASLKGKEPMSDDRVNGIEDLRLLLKEERVILHDKTRGEFQSRSAHVGATLEKFQRELRGEDADGNG